MSTSLSRAAPRRTLARAGRLLLALVPLVIGLPVLLAIARSVVDIVGLGHPFFNDVGGSSIDGYSLYLGGPLYQDPGAGYTPLAYPPLFALLTAGLDHLRVWTGWPMLLALAGELTLIGLAARLAYRPAGDTRTERAVAAAGAIGVGALVWWLVAFVPFNALYAPRGDHLSWALAFVGLALVTGDPSRRRLVGSVVLLTAACWVKQTAAIAVVAAVGGLVIAAAAGRVSWRVPALFAAAFALSNGLLFLAVDIGTSGWAWRFLIDMPSRHPRAAGLRESLRQMFHAIVPGLVVVAVLAVAVAADARRRGTLAGRPDARAWAWPQRWEERFGVVLVLFAILDALPSAYFFGAVGAAHNVFLGMAWALGLLVAVGFGMCAARTSTLAVAGVVVLALFAVAHGSGLQRRLSTHQIYVPPSAPRVVASEELPGLRAYATGHSVYHPIFTDLSAGPPYQDYDNVAALLASGYQPGHLVRALLDRRFEVVYLLDDSRLRAEQTGTGRWEDDYLWKLNQVMRARYRPFATVPSALATALHVPAGFATYDSPGVLERRPGPDPAPWMRDCFGPFRIGGSSWRIAHGGGFWCRPGGHGSVLTLVRTRAGHSQVRRDSAGAANGRSIRVSLPGGGGFAVSGGDGDRRWRVSGQATRGGHVSLVLTAGGRIFTADTAAPGPLTLTFRDDGPVDPGLRPGFAQGVLVRVPGGAGGPTSLEATRGSGASFDLSGLAG